MPRGKKSKIPIPKVIKETIDSLNDDKDIVEESLQELRNNLISKKINWDIKADDWIEYFDPTLSYERTHYRPIDEQHGFDFDPEWFQQAKRVKLETGRYCAYPQGTKRYHDFWEEEFNRCNNGYEVNGYRITGDNYFFLNYYQLLESNVKKSGQGRGMIFPEFYNKQYEYFHYVELCECLKKDVCAVKSRAVGFSEIAASLGTGSYTTRRNMNIVYTAFAEDQLKGVLKKAWYQLDNLNANTENGMKHVRQKYNSDMLKKASKINKQREEIPTSWNSLIRGQVADEPRKLRGDRVDRLFFEESGSNPFLVKTYIQGNALVEVLGNKIGTRFVWGTGGDQKYMEGLSKIFYNPKGFNILPYKHNYTKSGEYVYTGFFIPSFTFQAEFTDNRGVTNSVKAREYYQKKRDALLGDPKSYLIECAEFCFTPEDAFAFEGDNTFNIELLAEQQTAIKVHKIGPHIDIGKLEYKFRDNKHVEEMIEKVIFVPNPIKGKIHILEAPVTDQDNKIPRNLYVAGIDGIDMGGEDTSNKTIDPSDFCVVIFKRSFGIEPPKIVAYYKDRPQKIAEAHLNCLMLLQYYNAKAVLESTRISILQYFKSKKCADKYLMRRPRACQNDGGRSKQFGAPATETIIKHQLELISDYIDQYCQEIWFIEVVEELIKYSYKNKGKFDIVAALGMAMLADEELMFVKPKIETDKSNELQPFGYWTDSNGIKHKGRIPQNQPIVPKFNLWPVNYYDDERIRTSDPRINS